MYSVKELLKKSNLSGYKWRNENRNTAAKEFEYCFLFTGSLKAKTDITSPAGNFAVRFKLNS